MAEPSDDRGPPLARSSTRSSLLDVPDMDAAPNRPPNVTHVTTPAYESPLRHHHRRPSAHHIVKESLHATSVYTNDDDDGAAVRRINQYTIKQEVGRGSFGAVHLAVDQYGKEFAVKEFSKSRLRRRAQSSILRRPGARSPAGHLTAAGGINSPPHRASASDIHNEEEAGNPLYLIREEIAIMKKLNHPNLVALLEVLDDPTEDSLYMVLEMCKKGVVMKVGMHEPAKPYDSETCRMWFRDLILGIEYLHAQGVVHRDIKPDNLLLTDDDVLKIVDFGVSQMFEKGQDLMTNTSAGSPAFLPPELCVTNHGQISGKAADIWSIGVTLYCLYFGRVPFEKVYPMDLYNSIRNDDANIGNHVDDDLANLFHRMLEKDPNKRIQMEELREHPWVTRNGTDPLLSTQENVVDLVDPPTEEEMKRAITTDMNKLLVVVKAVRKFKQLLVRKRPEILNTILREQLQVSPTGSAATITPMRTSLHRSHSNDIDERRPIEQALVREGIHRKIDAEKIDLPLTSRDDAAVLGRNINKPVTSHPDGLDEAAVKTSEHYSEAASGEEHTDHLDAIHKFLGQGQADGSPDDFQFLAVGTSASQYPRTPQDSPPIISESPSAAEGNIYDTAYHEEVERIRSDSHDATLYMTRRVQDKNKYRNDRNMLGVGEDMLVQGLHNLVSKAKDARKHHEEDDDDEKQALKDSHLKSLIQGGSPTGLKKLKAAAVEDLKNAYQEGEASDVAGNAKDVAEAALQDIKGVQRRISFRGNSKTDEESNDNSGSAVKAAVKNLRDAYRDDKISKSTADAEDNEENKTNSMPHLRAAMEEVKQTREKVGKAFQSSDEQSSDTDKSMPGLAAVAKAVTKQ